MNYDEFVQAILDVRAAGSSLAALARAFRTVLTQEELSLFIERLSAGATN